MGQRASIHVSTVNALLDGCRNRGVSPGLVLLQVGESEELLADREARFPVSKMGDLIATISHMLHDETLGFLERPTPPGGLELWIHSCITARTLGQAIERWIRFWRMVHRDQRTEMTVDGDQVRVATVYASDDDLDRSSFITWKMFLMVRLASWLIGKPLLLDRVCFTFEEPVDREDYVDMFPTRHYFRHADNSFEFNRRFLDMPLIRPPESVPDFVRNLPHLMTVERVDHSYTARVRLMLQGAEQVDDVPLTCVAQKLNCSEDTIRRRLKAEGSAFTEIKESVRREMAIYHLHSMNTPINEIAYMLGFSEPSAFNRAFKRWTGETPGDFRRKACV